MPHISFIESPAFLDSALMPILKNPVMGYDLETTSLSPHTGSIRLMSFSDGDNVVVVDTWAIGTPPIIQDALQGDIIKLAHNAKFEFMYTFKQLQLKIQNPYCTQVADQVVKNGLEFRFSLDEVVRRRLGWHMDKTLQGSDFSGKLSWEQVVYSGTDSWVLPYIYHQQMAEAKKFNIEHIIRLENKVLPVFAMMELEGVLFSKERITKLYELYTRKNDELLREIQGLLGTIPLKRPDEPGKANKWFTATGNFTKKAREQFPHGYKYPDTNEEFRQAYRQLGVAVPTVRDKVTKENRESLSVGTYRKIQHESGPKLEIYFADKKLVDSFLRPIFTEEEGKKPWVNPATHRVHGGVKQNGTRTGRPSMSDPNLLNYPRDPDFRRCIVARPGYKILKLDYSQIELRMLAQVSRDENLILAYKADKDVHKMTASTVYNVTFDAVIKKQRDNAKNINFACCYEQTPWGLQDYFFKKVKQIISIDEAKHFIEAFFRTYPKVRTYHQWVHHDTLQCWEFGYTAWTPGGRPRFWEPKGIRKKTNYYEDESTVCNDAINLPMQGGVADGIKLAMVESQDVTDELNSSANQPLVYPILQVYDELVFEVKDDEQFILSCAERYGQTMVKCMSSLIEVVPVSVEASFGPSWGETQPAGEFNNARKAS